MIDINELYEQFNSKFMTSQAGFFRPVRDFVPAVHEASLSLFNFFGKKLEKSQAITDIMQPFIRGLNISVEKLPTMDFAPLPPDYAYYSDARVLIEKDLICGARDCDLYKEGECIPYAELQEDFFPKTSEFSSIPVVLVQNAKWTSATTHPNRKPSMEKQRMICTPVDGGFEILPKGIGVIVLYYYRLPVKPVFDYDQVESGPDVYAQYKKATSTQLEWNENAIPLFLYKLGKRYGLTVQSELITQINNLDKDLL